MLLAVIATAGLAALGAISPASAHMGVATSNPANGSEVDIAPQELTIRFSTDVELDSAQAQIRYIGGLDAPVSDLNRRDVRTDALTKTAGAGQGADVSFALPELPAGLYAIDWSVEEIGGHGNNSMILFKVTTGVGGDSPSPVLYGAIVAAAVVLAAGAWVLRRRS